MIGRDFLIGFIDLVVGAAALMTYMRRDRGIVPEDGLPDALADSMKPKERRQTKSA